MRGYDSLEALLSPDWEAPGDLLPAAAPLDLSRSEPRSAASSNREDGHFVGPMSGRTTLTRGGSNASNSPPATAAGRISGSFPADSADGSPLPRALLQEDLIARPGSWRKGISFLGKTSKMDHIPERAMLEDVYNNALAGSDASAQEQLQQLLPSALRDDDGGGGGAGAVSSEAVPSGAEEAARAASPLRPGVFMGCDDETRQLVNAAARLKVQARAPLGHGPSRMATWARHGGAQSGGRGKRPAAHAGNAGARAQSHGEPGKVQAAVIPMKWARLEEEEDETLAEEKRQYSNWKQEVIKCATNMQLEVKRFHIDRR